MNRNWRFAALHLALAAMVLRALLPAGWMPGSTAGAPLVVCSVHGAEHNPSRPREPSDREHTLCPFAAAVQIAVDATAIALPMPQSGIRIAPSPLRHPQSATTFPAYSSRAPPAHA
jgi:hypothetical protein